MSVNGLGCVSGAHVENKRKIGTPFELESNHIHNVYVERDQQANRTLEPTPKMIKLSPLSRSNYASTVRTRQPSRQKTSCYRRISDHEAHCTGRSRRGHP